MLHVFSRDLEPITYGLWRPLLRQLDEMFESQTQASTQSQRQDPWTQGRPDFTPPYEVHEADDSYVMIFDIPGVRRDDLNIELVGNRLVISGERQSEGAGARGRYGKFHQVFTLPDGVAAEGLVAQLNDGVLRLSIPKPSAAKPTKIKIGEGTGKHGFMKHIFGEKKTSGASETETFSEDPEPHAVKN